MNAFDNLSLDEKNDLIKKGGTAIITISISTFVVTLFVIDNFYAERYYNTETHNIEGIRSAEYPQLLKYLDHIAIHEVYELLQ